MARKQDSANKDALKAEVARILAEELHVLKRLIRNQGCRRSICRETRVAEILLRRVPGIWPGAWKMEEA